jgi:hypothetical protein
MTLLELSVALAVGGAALAAGGAAVATRLDRREAVLADAELDGRALAARRMLVTWVSDVRAAAAAGAFDGRQGTRRTPSGNVADDSVSFLTTAGGEVQTVQLFVDRAADQPTLVAEVGSPHNAPVRIALAQGVAGLEVSYLTSAFGRREWRRAWNGTLLPTAVVLRLQPADGVVLPAPLRLPITIPLANGQ